MQELQLTVNTLYTTIYFTEFNLWKRSEKDSLLYRKVPSREKKKKSCAEVQFQWKKNSVLFSSCADKKMKSSDSNRVYSL